MKVTRTILWILIIALLGVGFYYFDDLVGLYGQTEATIEKNVDARLETLARIEEKVVTSSPLRGPTASIESMLTVAGIIAETNRERRAEGLPPLAENSALSIAARAKVNDMFARQYFEHKSPTGEGPGDLAKEAGYRYLKVGENLALGNYKNDRVIVEAWMNSPGHRANILDRDYSEIGIFVMRGNFKGDDVWLAVQEFGRPASDCSAPSTLLESEIAKNQEMLDGLEQDLSERRFELEHTQNKRSSEYREKVEAYNEVVEHYNELVVQTKSLIDAYNEAVNTFNACLSS